MKKYVFKIEKKDSIGFSADIIKKLNLKSGDEVEIRFHQHSLLVEKSVSFCLVCGERKKLNKIGNNRFMCEKCLLSLNEILKEYNYNTEIKK